VEKRQKKGLLADRGGLRQGDEEDLGPVSILRNRGGAGCVWPGMTWQKAD